MTAVVASGLAAAIVAFFLVRDRSTPMSWLRAEFSLSEQQARNVEQIHSEYEADCAQMCARIAQTDERLANLECNERANAVREAVSGLPSNLREALILFEYEDLSYDQIAKIQGCSAKAVETRL